MTHKKIVIVGGVAGGASAAARARRLNEQAEIIIFERDHFISFANCGLPYHIGGEITNRSALLVQTPESMRARFNLDIRIESEVTGIDSRNKCVHIKHLATGREYTETYDELILSPGAKPIIPKLPGVDLPQVFVLRNIPDMDNIIRHINDTAPKSAAVIGGGFIGIEMAEALAHRGIKTSLIELSDQVLGVLDSEMATPLHREIRKKGVNLVLGHGVKSIAAKGDRLSLHIDDQTLETDMVIMAIGVRPDISLIAGTEIKTGKTGGIWVNSRMQTSVEHIYAVGDAVEVQHFVSGEPTLVPLAGPANRQGRIAADNIFGRDSEYRHTQGTAICKVFDLAAGGTGMNEKQLKASGRPYEKVYVHANDHASYYPGAKMVSMKLLFALEDGKILGAQATGEQGVDKRLDVLATMIRAGMTVYDMEEAELCYAPPYGSAKDIINQAGFVASNILRGDVQVCHANEMLDDPNTLILDVRNPEELSELGAIDGAVNIPLPTLRARMAEIPMHRNVLVYCGVGLRGYVATRMLTQHGYLVKNLSGGYKTYQSRE